MKCIVQGHVRTPIINDEGKPATDKGEILDLRLDGRMPPGKG
jgi:hypothetical protein